MAMAIVLLCSCVSKDSAVEIKPVETVIEVEGATAAELLGAVNRWMVSAFNDSGKVKEYEDEDTILGKYLTDIYQEAFFGYTAEIWTLMTFKAEEGRLSVTFEVNSYDFTHNHGRNFAHGVITQDIHDKLVSSWISMLEEVERVLINGT